MIRFARRAALILLALYSAANAQTPKQLTIVYPYSAGGAGDVMARALATLMSKELGVNAIVVNREGASGVIGMTNVMASPPDGSTIGFTPMATVTTQPHLNSSVKINPDKLEPICGVSENVLGIVVRSDSPFSTVDDLLRAAKVRSLSYGSPGPNSGPFFGIATLAKQQKAMLVHVPYRGDAPSLNDLLAGNVDFAGSIAASAAPFIQAGKMRLLAVMSTNRHPSFPTVPTLQEKFGVSSPSYAGLFAPKGVPLNQLERMDLACSKVVTSSETGSVAERTNQVVRYQDRKSWTKQVREDFQKQRLLVESVGEKVN